MFQDVIFIERVGTSSLHELGGATASLQAATSTVALFQLSVGL